jgi:hypothetical protein
MKKQLTYIAPVRAGIVLGVLYGILSLVFVPFLLLGLVVGAKTHSPLPAVFGLFFVIFIPVVYGVLGFIFGLLSAALYNLISKWTGGFEFEFSDAAPAAF